jgi:hypothetical protein
MIRQTLLEITGTATAGSQIIIQAGTAVIGQTTAAADGAWDTTADISNLDDGTHQLTITSRHPGSQTTSTTMTITVDRHVSIPAGLTATQTPAGVVISGRADPGSTVTVLGTGTRATATADSADAWTTAPITTLPSGYSTATATATDAAGNTSPPSAPLDVTTP